MEENLHTNENERREISAENLSNITLKPENNLNDYCFILLDVQLKNQDCQLLLEDLRKITNENILAFDNIDSIHQSSQMNSNAKIFLILSGSLGQICKTQLIEIVNIQFLYIFCRDSIKHTEWSRDLPKIRGVFNDKHQLFITISRDVKEFARRWKFDNESSFLKASSYDTRWYHLFINTLLYLPCTENDRKAMFNECRSYYQKNAGMLNKIDRLEREYTPERAIYYYTDDNFLYRILNSALRTHNMDIISKFYPFIQDLNQQLYERYRKYCFYLKCENINLSPVRIVYRGQYLSPLELEQLRDLCRSRRSHVLLSMFGSATLDPDIAMNFIPSDHSQNISCFFQILIPDYYYNCNKISTLAYPFQMLLDVSNLSAMPEEQEVLFSVMSRFRVDYVGDSAAERPWIPIILEFCCDDQEFDPHWHQIRGIVSRESDEMKQELFELVKKYQNKTINWDVWWQQLADQCGARRRDSIELRKNDFEKNSEWKKLSDHERADLVFNEIKYGKPTRVIALYEFFFQNMNLSQLNTDKLIEVFRCAGDAYAKCGCFQKNASESYEKALEFAENHSYDKIISELRNQIQKLSFDQQPIRSKRRKQIPRNETKNSPSDQNSSIQTSQYETEHLQWFIFWQWYKILPNIDENKKCKVRLEYLRYFLKRKEEWLDSSDLRIFFNLPFQRNQNIELPENIYPFFYSSIRSYFHGNTILFKNRLLNKWFYEKFINDWLTLNDLKRIITVNSFKEHDIVTSILILLERILQKLSLIITVLTFIIIVSSTNDTYHLNIDVNQIRFQTDACIHPKRLVFFDIKD
ncbi:unnamed protein product [Adineta ricciae]|uniref:Uncharacterized protein n=1 Tax=Adineta ricciae TaxID=249248 RepID=A0A815QVL9_ADIRI|nr:unnamed protein product [Adineta ricciae]CAF1533779.1 unnamed protein product [Adineta ricciae]